MKKIVLLPLLVLTLSIALMAPAVWAATYGMAGCGLGALVFENKNDQVSQVLAATTNGTFGSQTFGITSGTSECTADGVIRSERAQEAFAEVNFENLAQDMAKGQGEHLAAFVQLLGCSEANVGDFGRLTQQHYQQIFSRDPLRPIDLVEAVKQSIANDPILSRACQG
jgi:hypothetical protein